MTKKKQTKKEISTLRNVNQGRTRQRTATLIDAMKKNKNLSDTWLQQCCQAIESHD